MYNVQCTLYKYKYKEAKTAMYKYKYKEAKTARSRTIYSDNVYHDVYITPSTIF